MARSSSRSAGDGGGAAAPGEGNEAHQRREERSQSVAHMPVYSRGFMTPLTRNQIRGFWAAWGGWALDGMDSFIYALVLVPALTELLPRSGIPATPGNIGFYGSVLFALFLVGWGLSMIWGPLADRFGRVVTLSLTIVCYSVFTLACGLAATVWQLAVFRVIAGIGIGGEWSMGGTFIAEEWPEDRRRMGAGYMHTGTTSASSSPRSPTTSSARSTAGA